MERELTLAKKGSRKMENGKMEGKLNGLNEISNHPDCTCVLFILMRQLIYN